MSYVHFEVISPKNAGIGYFSTYDGTITINLDELVEDCDSTSFCNSEGVIIAKLIDVLIHEELHKRFDEAGDENHEVLNEQDERIFKIIRDHTERNKLYNPYV